MSGDFISMKISEVRRETGEAVTILLSMSDTQQDALRYLPGQYITVRWREGSREHRRSYSICSIPGDPHLAFTVKEVKGGKISPILCRKVKPGDTLEIMPPDGRFTADIGQDTRRTLYLIGAGSGITPLMSIARYALEKEPKSTVVLLYGSRTEEDIIFREALDRMVAQHQQQFYVYHTLSRPDGGGMGLVKSLFGRKKPEWQGLRGRISPAHLADILKTHPTGKQNDLFFICGPGDLIVMAEKTLRDSGIPEEQIKKEFFTAASTDPYHHSHTHPPRAKGQPAQVKVHLRGQEINIEVTDKSILDTMLDKGFDAPYSCHSGACATCMAKVISGEVDMDACFALSDKEVANGYVLACQSHPVTETVEITFDE